MDDIVKITLDNELDLILVHKRCLKLAELAGLSLSSQTSFATAVSEVSRNAIENGKRSYLVLKLDCNLRSNYIVACLTNQLSDRDFKNGLEYAKKLVDKFEVSRNGLETSLELYYQISNNFKADLEKLDEWRTIFRNEPALSAYEEIKRQNEKLQELSDLLQKSEGEYKTLTNALPLLIFTIDLQGQLLYANEWLSAYTGKTFTEINKDGWHQIVHPEDMDSFMLLLTTNAAKDATAVKTQARLKQVGNDGYYWHQVSITPFKNEADEVQYWIGYFVDIHAQKVYEEALKDNAELKQAQQMLQENQRTLETYIEELNRSNLELQQFAFVASHDLQEPVRKMLFYSDYLIKQYTGQLGNKGTDYLTSMRSAAQRMRNLIQDLLVYSQINKEQIKFEDVDLNKVAKEALVDLELAVEESKTTVHVGKLPNIKGDERMMRQLFENIISNSIKYARKELPCVVNISSRLKGDYYEIKFEDNGIGFDEKYLPKMFTLFQRLHSKENYQGTGLGLAICLKIVEMHNGKISARASEGQGASFLVSLPVEENKS